MALDLTLSISPAQAIRLLDDGVVRGSITGERVDTYVVHGDQGRSCVVAVYEKHYYRAGNRLTLTVTVDDLNGQTRLHAVGAGGGEGLFRFDWGASESFGSCPREILRDYIIR